jgi:hypothetical protein
MPKMFEKIHKGFLERYFDIGEKKRVDKSFKSFAKDRDNCLLPVRLYVKVFPLLNESIFYCGMATKEQLDDVILIDNKFNIQAITRKLVQKFDLDNKNVFQENDIPFYIICRKFIHFYKIFLKGTKNKKKNNKNKSNGNSTITGGETTYNTTNFSGTNIQSNFKSSNNFGTSADHDFSDTKGNSNTNMDSEVTGSGVGVSRPSNQVMMSTNKLIEEVMGDGGPVEDSADIEINENIELEYEIQIPMFLRDYMDSMNKKDKNKKLIKSGTSRSEQESKEDNDETKEEYDENDGLVTNDEIRGPETEGKEGKNFNKQSDEDKEFQIKIRTSRNLFEMGKFDELEDFIQRINIERPAKEYKFNFTFEKYSYGNRGMSYFIRCIDNKAEYDDSQSNNMSINGNGDEKVKAYRQQKSKIESLKEVKEVTADDKNEITERLADYIKLCMDGGDFTKNLSNFRDEIAMTSKIFGMKKEEANLEDENSSQSSSSGFNDNIAKKSRIEEIRSNIMNNVSNFYTLKWIKGIFYFIILLTAAFCGFYLMIFDIINNDLSSISNLNIGLYQTTIWTCNIISTLISLRSTYQFNLRNYPIKYYSYIPDQIKYYQNLSNFTKSWYKDVITNFGHFEKQINVYFDNSLSPNMFWKQESITYPASKVVLADTESLTMTLSQVLSDTNQLLQNPYFTNNPSLINDQKFTSHKKELINYSSFMAIENALDNLLPRLFQILNAAPVIFLDQNNGNMKYVIIIVLGYTFTILLMIFIYGILLYLTNKNMEEGLEKVSKIKLERIDETIKKIDSFNDKCLSKFRQKETKTIIVEEVKEIKNEVHTTNNSSSQMKEAYQKIFSEGQKYKRLRVLSYSYIQVVIIFIVCCANLIPIYFVSLSMINSSNQILSVQNYIFGKSLAASSSTVNIKCVISQCQTANPQNYMVNTVDRSTIESIIRDITNFPGLSEFYSNKFLLNACAVIWDSSGNDTKYNNCMTDTVIKSANNTDSLLKLIDETVSTIIKDKEMKNGQSYTLSNNVTTIFSNPLLYESKNFRDLEYIFYNYITPISDAFADVVSASLDDYLSDVKMNIVILICVFVFCILLFSFYIAFIFTRKLIHLLSVARVILKIIPTSVINNTQDLETWIESRY